MRAKHEALQEVLNAFASLFTQPLEQDIGASLKAATAAISLATLPGLGLWFNGGNRALGEFGFPSFVLVLVWMLLSVFTKQDKKRGIARNLSVLSFWIVATLVVVFVVEIIRPDPLDAALRRGLAVVLLLILIPADQFLVRSLPFWLALRMTLALGISTSFLAWMAL